MHIRRNTTKYTLADVPKCFPKNVTPTAFFPNLEGAFYFKMNPKKVASLRLQENCSIKCKEF